MPAPEDAKWPAELLIEIAARRGITLDRARAEALQAPAESLFRRLGSLARTLPETAAPPPQSVPAPRARAVSLQSTEFASAIDLRQRFESGALSPVEVLETLLARIERLDPRLGAFLEVTAESARREARAAEAEFRAGKCRGPLHGVPVGIKDLFDTAGVRTTAGSRILRDRIPERDAFVVERLREGGAVILGKLNLHEFAFGLTSDNPHYGPCRNPWNRDRVAGGSSGGSAAALAAGLCPLALGTDTGGSIRIPAAACGIVGIKPTLGAVSRRGVIPLAWSFDTVGAMARTVPDAAPSLEAIAVPDPEDPWCAKQRIEGVARDLEAGARDLRLGVVAPAIRAGIEPDIESAFTDAVSVLRAEGARIVEVEFPALEPLHTAHHAILASEASAWHRPWITTRPEDYGDDVRRGLELGSLIAAVDYIDARRAQERFAGIVAGLFDRVDVILTPTLPRAALAVGEPFSREPAVAWNRFLTPFNLLGLPAASIPIGLDRDRLPIGLQIAGREWDEATVLRVARAYERAVPSIGLPPLAEP